MSTMLLKSLKPSVIRLELQATTKEKAIHELVSLLDEVEGLDDPAEAERVVLARERIMSTGMPNGIALPHGKTDTVNRLMVALAVKRGGLPFDCPDGQPAQLVILTLSPASKAGPHIQFLAEISTVLRVKEARQAIVACETAEEIIALLTERTWR